MPVIVQFVPASKYPEPWAPISNGTGKSTSRTLLKKTDYRGSTVRNRKIFQFPNSKVLLFPVLEAVRDVKNEILTENVSVFKIFL